MDLEALKAQAATYVRNGALEAQKATTSKLVTASVDMLHTGMDGITPMIEKDYLMQKSMLNAAYADKGIGTRLNTET